MTERRPSGATFQSWVDQQIRAAQERGEFDDLPGAGKPLPGLDRPYDEMWWVRQKLRSEGLSTDALLPTPLALRKEIEALPRTVQDLPTEQAVREVVRDLNRRVAEWIRLPAPGPYVPVRPARVEDVLEQWRAGRQAPPAAAPTGAGQSSGPRRPPGWWRRLTRLLRRARPDRAD